MKKNGGTGTIHVTWERCPNKKCASRSWPIWDVDFNEEDFKCGTCELPLSRPVFECPVTAKHSDCPFIKGDAPEPEEDG